MDESTREILSQNLESVRARIAAAAARAGRSPADVTLVGVTKSASPEAARALADLGLADLGENRVQELERKRSELPPSVRWHLVGPLQSNKARRALCAADLLHGLDDPALLPRLERIAEEEGLARRALLEVNVSGEATKHGLVPASVLPALEGARGLSRIAIVGLMTMAPLDSSPREQRSVFRGLRELRDAADRRGLLRAGVGRPGELSMGMTQDFEVAIEEGATYVRIGTALFEPREARVSA